MNAISFRSITDLWHVHWSGEEVGGHVADQNHSFGVRDEVKLNAVHRLIAAVVNVRRRRIQGPRAAVWYLCNAENNVCFTKRSSDVRTWPLKKNLCCLMFKIIMFYHLWLPLTSRKRMKWNETKQTNHNNRQKHEKQRNRWIQTIINKNTN